jgi:putative nucleotidyltransferase with HDIG domain
MASDECTGSILFAAALFHDIAKPETTQVSQSGMITAKRHVNLGARIVREILKDIRTPFAIRETIVAIVKYESLPIWFWDKPQPLRSIIRVRSFEPQRVLPEDIFRLKHHLFGMQLISSNQLDWA